MTRAELDEAVSVLNTMMTAVSGVLVGSSGPAAVNLRYAINDLIANADYLLRSASLGQPLWSVFQAASAAGATITQLEAVRTTLTGLTPVSALATALCNVGVQMVMAIEVGTYAGTTFTSRQDVDAAITQLRTAFGAALEFAADNHDPSSFQALNAARAAILTHLQTTARPLPQMITYSVGRVLTSHALAQRLYGDASRCDELVAENKFVFPAFCSPTGSALSE